MRWLAANDFSDNSFASHYCHDHSQHAANFIRNVKTDLYLLVTDQHRLVCSVNQPVKFTNSYVVSPYCAYVDYCLVEIARLKKIWITFPLSLLVKLLGLWLKVSRVDANVQINNWLVSTNLYPKELLDDQSFDVQSCRDLVTTHYPGHAIIFRSLNQRTNAELIVALSNQDFILIPSRQVYFFDARQGEDSAFTQKHNYQLDKKFLQKTQLHWRYANEFSDMDFERAALLYRQLYIEKYCQHNPEYSAHWLQAGYQSGWLRLQGLADDHNQLQAIVGWFENNEVMTAPIVGYNTAWPINTGLYRLITQACFDEACRQKKLLNFSSGAAHFKRLRGGEHEIEYSLVYVEHLNLFRRATWKTMAFLLNRLAVPLMKKWQL